MNAGPMQVAAVATPSDAATMAGALAWAYQQVTGRSPPSRSSWMIPLAQSSFETAHWSQMYNWNAGYISQPNSSQPFYYRGSNPVPFAVYPNIGAGAVALMAWLQKHGGLAAADNNDLGAYTSALRSGGYLGNNGDYATYAAGIANLMDAYASVSPRLYPGASIMSMSTGMAIVAGVAILGATGTVAYYMSGGSMHGASRSLAQENPVRKRKAMRVQSLLFSRDSWTPSAAKSWSA